MSAELAARIPVAGEHFLEVGERSLRLTSLDKTYWPDGGWTKGDLLRWYAAVAEILLPYVRGRPIVMKRYPDGIEGESFFMKRTPSHAPDWLTTCSIEHASGNVIDFAVVDDAAALLWLPQIGCVSLHPWPSRCDDVDRPDFLTFDLDPVEGTGFDEVREAALVVERTLAGLGAPAWAKTTGSRGIHVFVPIERGPTQKEVWRVAKSLALSLESLHPELLTAVYRKADRPKGRVLVDYNQNAWGRTLASVYSARPRPGAPVSAPVTWEEIDAGIETLDFTIESMPARLEEVGDPWASMLEADPFPLADLLTEADAAAD